MSLQTLEQTLRQLRHAWTHDWPGLPRVVEGCVTQLGGAQGRAAAAVMACMTSLAHQLERHGARLGEAEPPYHNRLHVADTLVSLTVLLQSQRRLTGRTERALNLSETLLLLAMLGHDAWHPGTRNRRPFELEARSAQRVLAVMGKHGLSARARTEVKRLILATEPHVYRQAACAHVDHSCGLSQLACRDQLVREADILSSTLPAFAPGLTRALSSEWARFDAALAQRLLAPVARRRFLRELARFESPAAQALGLPQVVRHQLRD